MKKNNQNFSFDALELGKYMGIITNFNVMTVNRFEKIREYLHINNKDEYDAENPDRLFKVRPMVNTHNVRFQSIPMPPRLSIDEQMCSTKVGHYVKQYLPLQSAVV